MKLFIYYYLEHITSTLQCLLNKIKKNEEPKEFSSFMSLATYRNWANIIRFRHLVNFLWTTTIIYNLQPCIWTLWTENATNPPTTHNPQDHNPNPVNNWTWIASVQLLSKAGPVLSAMRPIRFVRLKTYGDDSIGSQ